MKLERPKMMIINKIKEGTCEIRSKYLKCIQCSVQNQTVSWSRKYNAMPDKSYAMLTQAQIKLMIPNEAMTDDFISQDIKETILMKISPKY